jgi:hypothetical protein
MKEATRTILDIIHDHHAPYPCRYCGAMAVPMTFNGIKPAGIKFIQEHYPNNFFIQSCRCIDDLVDKMDEEKRIKEQMAEVRRQDWNRQRGPGRIGNEGKNMINSYRNH